MISTVNMFKIIKSKHSVITECHGISEEKLSSKRRDMITCVHCQIIAGLEELLSIIVTVADLELGWKSRKKEQKTIKSMRLQSLLDLPFKLPHPLFWLIKSLLSIQKSRRPKLCHVSAICLWPEHATPCDFNCIRKSQVSSVRAKYMWLLLHHKITGFPCEGRVHVTSTASQNHRFPL